MVGTLDKTNSGWIIRYREDRDNLIIYHHVMLHPNQENYAEIGKECKFRIERCPDLNNGGEFLNMAIIDTGEAKHIGEIMEKFKDKVMFPKMVERAKESLRGITLPEPNETKTEQTDVLAKLLDKYVKEKHTQEECIGFIDGFNECWDYNLKNSNENALDFEIDSLKRKIKVLEREISQTKN